MMHDSPSELIPDNEIIDRIFSVRGHNVMLDNDLAEMYGVDTKVLNQAVRRNALPFPKDFMFQLTPQEWEGANIPSTYQQYSQNKGWICYQVFLGPKLLFS